ncbi:ribokinase [Francisella adeliensis]|uniref:Ribokinase n=1 Tax=Francisella adeliensis TaxID=2007306 RepID=A0A2Z4Y258_9GAMM|nr:ribokinase [Francisella adeliensis]AXA34605.1 ribokinase [Francisella adeliensis]MBK2086330.1 ribokinase [Francisella adeliensis]MBK2096545.1 ribokinase [Francisella adeliensis]QIW12849.1 ribokinase [Francisella adeliensis]QIW14726.1 ribokinase [Francisella adeliensis]
MSISIIGSANRDLVVKVSKLAQKGQTIISKNYDEFCGGKGANQAVAAKRLGAEVSFIAKLGDDSFGNSLLNFYKNTGLNTSTIQKSSESKTGLAFITVDDFGQNIINVVMGANAEVDKEIIDTNELCILDSSVVLTQLEIPLNTVEYLADMLTEKNTFILNPAPAQTLPDNLLKKVDIITPNETEASIIAGVEITDLTSAKTAANVIHKKGVNIVIITMGESGALLSKQDGTQELFPSTKVDVKDTTAAGDTFNGSLAHCLDKGFSIEQAIKIANKASARAVTIQGAENSAPTITELNQFFNEKII